MELDLRNEQSTSTYYQSSLYTMYTVYKTCQPSERYPMPLLKMRDNIPIPKSDVLYSIKELYLIGCRRLNASKRSQRNASTTPPPTPHPQDTKSTWNKKPSKDATYTERRTYQPQHNIHNDICCRNKQIFARFNHIR